MAVRRPRPEPAATAQRCEQQWLAGLLALERLATAAADDAAAVVRLVEAYDPPQSASCQTCAWCRDADGVRDRQVVLLLAELGLPPVPEAALACFRHGNGRWPEKFLEDYDRRPT